MKILCIDLNIIMSPCIRLYMDRVHTEENPGVVWQNLERSMGIGAHLSYDAGVLLKLANLIKENRNAEFIVTEHQKENVALIEERLCEARILCKGQELSSHQGKTDQKEIPDAEKTSSVTNIDFFCDAGDAKARSSFGFGVYNDDSWFGYLARNHQELDLCWIRATESSVSDSLIWENRMKIGLFSDTDKIFEGYDLVILSNSGQYVPYCYRHLGELLGVCAA